MHKKILLALVLLYSVSIVAQNKQRLLDISSDFYSGLVKNNSKLFYKHVDMKEFKQDKITRIFKRIREKFLKRYTENTQIKGIVYDSKEKQIDIIFKQPDGTLFTFHYLQYNIDSDMVSLRNDDFNSMSQKYFDKWLSYPTVQFIPYKRNNKPLSYSKVDIPPSIGNCSEEEQTNICFKNTIEQYIQEGLSKEKYESYGIKNLPKRLVIMFIISNTGTIQNIRVKGVNTELRKDFTKVLTDIRGIRPARHQGEAVASSFISQFMITK